MQAAKAFWADVAGTNMREVSVHFAFGSHKRSMVSRMMRRAMLPRPPVDDLMKRCLLMMMRVFPDESAAG